MIKYSQGAAKMLRASIPFRGKDSNQNPAGNMRFNPTRLTKRVCQLPAMSAA